MNADYSLLRKLPPLTRARGDRLYQHGERWWVDLSKENGAYLWGRRPIGVAHDWKNQLDKGLGGLLPSLFEKRFFRHLTGLFPFPHQAVLFRNHERAMAALEELEGRPIPFGEWHDPAFGPKKEAEFAFWRPMGSNAESFRVLYPLLPWSQVQARVLLFPGEQGDLPDSDLVAATELSALVKSVVMTIADGSDRMKRDRREAFWREFDNFSEPGELWRRQGPYLSFRGEPEDYETVFDRFLAAGFLLSPDMSLPCILPEEGFSTGEWKAFRGACRVSLSS